MKNIFYSFTYSLIHLFTNSLIHLFTYSRIHSFTHSRIRSFTYSLIHLLTYSLIFTSSILFAQNNQEHLSGKDSVYNDDYRDSMPTPFHISLDLGYGFDISNSKAITGDFNKMGSWNLFFNVGNFKSTFPEYYHTENGLKYYTFFAIGLQAGNSTTKLSLPSSGDEKISMSIFKLSPKFILSQAFGSDNFKVVPYVSFPMPGFYTLNRISYKNIPQNLSSGDRNFLNNYIDKINFGCVRESGVMFHLDTKYNLYLSYENLIAYPKLLMGKDIGAYFMDALSSMLLYAGTINLLGTKVGNQIQPTFLGYIVGFALQNAYMITTQYLRRDNMNWPFSSSKSIMIESFRLNFGYIL